MELDGLVGLAHGESFRVSRQIFEGLVGTKPGTADPAPLLAESWETAEDGLSTVFQLKEGVTFHDGTPFDAAAVKEFATGRLAHYKIPRYVRVVEEFPMTVTGKVRKVEMREATAARLGLG